MIHQCCHHTHQYIFQQFLICFGICLWKPRTSYHYNRMQPFFKVFAHFYSVLITKVTPIILEIVWTIQIKSFLIWQNYGGFLFVSPNHDLVQISILLLYESSLEVAFLVFLYNEAFHLILKFIIRVDNNLQI